MNCMPMRYRKAICMLSWKLQTSFLGERSNLLVDPSEEKLKAEFGQVQRTYVPIQSVIRIDEVSKEGKNKIIRGEHGTQGQCFFVPGATVSA